MKGPMVPRLPNSEFGRCMFLIVAVLCGAVFCVGEEEDGTGNDGGDSEKTTWVAEFVAQGEWLTRIGVDADANPYILFYTPGSELGLATLRNGLWEQETITDGVSETEKMRVSRSGAVHIARYNHDRRGEYITDEEGIWTTERVFDGEIDRIDLALTPDQRPNLLATGLVPDRVMIGEKQNGLWVTTEIPIEEATYVACMEIDSEGASYFVVGLNQDPSAYVATDRSGGWETILFYEGNEQYHLPWTQGSDMTIAADDTLHAAVGVGGSETPSEVLVYVGDLLGEQETYAFNVVAGRSRIAIGPDRTAFLLFYENDAQTSWVTTAIQKSGVWQTQTLIAHVIQDFDIVVDAEGRPHVSVVQDGNVWYFTQP